MDCANCAAPVMHNALCADCAYERGLDTMIGCNHCERQAVVEVYQESTTFIREIDADGYPLDPLDDGENQEDYERVGETIYLCQEHRNR